MISDQRLAELADENTICKLEWDERIAIAQELIQLRGLVSQQSQPPMLLPPPITESDGYRLNTSWHSGAIFRDGANWMRDEAMRLGAGVPEGWKMVPIIASPSQWAAGQKAFDSAGINKVDSVYKAMVSTAPEVK